MTEKAWKELDGQFLRPAAQPPAPARAVRISTARRLKLTLRYFPPVFCEDYSADLGAPGYPAFVALAKIRRRMTHPRRLEHLFAVPAISCSYAAMRWYFAESGRQLRRLQTACGEDLPRRGASPPALKIPEIALPDTVLDEAFYDNVFNSATSSLAYIKYFFGQLLRETFYALDLLKAVSGRPGEADTDLFLRNALRSVVATSEGIAGVALFLLESYLRRGEIEAELGDLQSVWRLEPSERLRQSLELFALHFGNGPISLDAISSRWRSFREVVETRDRLTHPETAADLAVDMDYYDHLLAALEVLSTDVSQYLELQKF